MIKHGRKTITGIFLICLSLFSLPLAVVSLIPRGYFEFPCGAWEPSIDPKLDASKIRIAYCINMRSRSFIGSFAYLKGNSSIDEADIVDHGDLVKHGSASVIWSVERQGTDLVIDSQIIQLSERFTGSRWSFTLNPWLISTEEWVLENNGIIEGTDTIYMLGEVKKGGTGNPLGLIILAIGGYFYMVGMNEEKQTKEINNDLPTQEPSQ